MSVAGYKQKQKRGTNDAMQWKLVGPFSRLGKMKEAEAELNRYKIDVTAL